MRAICIGTVVVVCAWSGGAIAAVQSADLDFATSGQSMWGPGAGFNLDQTWTDFLFNFGSNGNLDYTDPVFGYGLTLPYSYSGTVGLEPRLRISSGAVDVAYPIRVDASLPDEVQRSATFSIDTSSWVHKESSISTTGPGARFTLDAVLKFNATLGQGLIDVPWPLDDVVIPEVTLGVDYRKSIIDVGSGSTGVTIPAGPYGSVELSIPEILELSSNALIPPELAKLKAEGQADDRFVNLALDLDAVAVSLFGLPPNLLGDEYVIVADGGGDPRPDLSIEYELLNVQANLGLKFAQAFTFIPTSIGLKLTSELGEVRTGLLGDVFTFTAPDENGLFHVDAEYTLNGQLRSQTGFVVNGSLQVEAGKFVLHNEFGPDFDVNLAQLLGFDSDYLFSQEFPEGGFNFGPPLYIFDSTFAFGGFEKQFANYSIMVVPEASSAVLLGLAAGAASVAAVRTARRRRALPSS